MKYTLQEDNSFPGGIPPTPFTLHESMKDKLDPEYVKFFNSTLSTLPNIIYTHRTPLKKLKEAGNVLPGQATPSEMEKIFDIEIPRKHTSAPKSIPARVFVPKGTQPENGWPLFIWFHGGGWVLGNITTENSFCTKIADLAKAVVVTVDYRLAPEDPFPACVDDAFEATMWAFEGARSQLDMNIDINNVGIGGSSAGGNLTAIVTNKYASSPAAKDLPPVKFQVMIVPVTDNTATTENNQSWKENEFTPQLPAEKMLWYRALYLPNEEDAKKPEASPLFYSNESFSKVPPCFIAAGECDVLRSEAEAYADKLRANGVPTELVIYKGMPHTTMVMDGILQQGKDLVNQATTAIRNAFYK